MSATPRLAIHDRPGSFSDRWIEYCEANDVRFTRVACHDTRILDQLRTVDGLLWHWRHDAAEDLQCAPRLIPAAEAMGLRVFPNYSTCWHYDDKVAQKYLLEAIGAPLVPTWVFYEREKALAWIDRATFPVVFKLARGAGSQNVWLAKSVTEAQALVSRAFSQGFIASPGLLRDFWTKAGRHLRDRDLSGTLLRLRQTLAGIRTRRQSMQREKGYLLFQEFIPDNRYDTRITVIGDRAFGFTRDVRPGDFRASGSGAIVYDRARIDEECVRVAFAVVDRIGSQSLAFDFVKHGDGQPRIVEISYAYLAEPVHRCPGHWKRDLQWSEGHVWPEDAIIEDLLRNFGVGR